MGPITGEAGEGEEAMVATSMKELFEIVDRMDQEEFAERFTEVEASYVRADGHEVTLPAVTVARLQGDLIGDYRIYMDVNPLFA